MTTATATAIATSSVQLQHLDLDRSTTTYRQSNRDQSSLDPSSAVDTDPILQASQLADSSVPDGEYGWVIVFSCAVLAWWAVGTSYCWGVVQDALVADKLSSTSTLSFVGSLATAVISALAILNSRVVRLLGVRWMAIVGVGLMGTSEICSGFVVGGKGSDAGRVGGLFVTAGAVMGVGMSFCFTVMSVTPAQYFSKRRGLANGIVFAGGGLGGAVNSFAINALVQHVGIAWTYRVLGLMTLATGLPAAYLLKERSPIRPAGFIEWRLFRNPQFSILFLAGAIGTFPLLVPPFFLPLYSHSIGLSASTGAGLVAGFNFSSAIGRIMSGYLCDRLGPLNTLFLAFALSALSMLAVWPVSTTLAPMVVFVLVNGASNGGFFATMPTVVGNVFGSARLGIAMGMIVTGWGGGYLMGAPIAGYLLEAYGGAERGFEAYRPAIFYAGSMALGAAGLVLMVRLKASMSLFVKM